MLDVNYRTNFEKQMNVAGAGVKIQPIRDPFSHKGGSPFTQPGDPVRIPGFGGSIFGQHRFVRNERYQETPAAGMGRTAVYDEQFAKTVGEYGAYQGYNHKDPHGMNLKPLWALPSVIEQRHAMEVQNQLMTEHGPVEGWGLYREGRTRQVGAVPYVIPTQKPQSSERPFQMRHRADHRMIK